MKIKLYLTYEHVGLENSDETIATYAFLSEKGASSYLNSKPFDSSVKIQEVELSPQPSDEFVIISKEEYKKLKDDKDFLDSLHAAGVNNWKGYYKALLNFK